MSEAAAAQPAPWRPVRNGRIVIVIVATLALAGVLAVLAAWRLPPFDTPVERTEDAYVRGDTTVISPQVSGYVWQVAVRDFDHARAGQLLVKIDDRIYRQRVEQARAQLDAAKAALANNVQGLASRQAAQQAANASVTNARAQLVRAQADERRVADLVRDGSVSRREADGTMAALEQAQAGLAQASATNEGARQDVKSVVVNRGALVAAVEAAAAALQAVRIDLENTLVRAPRDGQLSDIGVRVGQYVTSGTQLLFLVPPPRPWVIANYKEAQTARMAPGQRAWFTVDALGGARVEGRVERISPAAGSEFAVLKPDNATGNFVKVAQRISVRIAIDPGQRIAERLAPGMSVETHVETAAGPSGR